MPDYAYEYCKEMITKNNNTKPLNTNEKKINKSIVNYDDTVDKYMSSSI